MPYHWYNASSRNSAWERGYEKAQFSSKVGATSGCTLRLLLNSIAEEDNGLKHCIQGDAWFGSVRNANEVGLRGHEGIFQVKQYHSLFPKEFIKNALKDAPGGAHIVLEGSTKDEVKLVAIGYRYSRKTILHFILTKNSGKLEARTPYEMKYTDTYGNVCVRGVERPDVISKFFQTSNIIGTHNQLWQDFLCLETKWRIRSAYFCLSTTLIRINVTDCFLLAGHHKVINYSSNYGADGKRISIQ
jgi:hypothetical protein